MGLGSIRNIFSISYRRERKVFQIRNDDVFLVSYPKSGNTWLRFLIGNYLTNGIVDFKNSHHIIPDVHFNPEDIDKIVSRPRFIKSHASFDKRFKNVVYIVRDGRDVAVSYFYYLRKTGHVLQGTSFEEYFNDQFVTGQMPFGDWGVHVGSWLAAKKVNLIMIKYEDLMVDTFKVFSEVLSALKIKNIDQELIRKSIQLSSFENMQKNESDNPEYFLQKFGLKDTGYGFMRKGEMGDWKTHFTTDTLRTFDIKYGKLMKVLNY